MTGGWGFKKGKMVSGKKGLVGKIKRKERKERKKKERKEKKKKGETEGNRGKQREGLTRDQEATKPKAKELGRRGLFRGPRSR